MLYKIGIGINYTNQLQQAPSDHINCVISGVVSAMSFKIQEKLRDKEHISM